MPQIQDPSKPVGQSQATAPSILFTPGGLPAQQVDNDELTTYFRMRSTWYLNDRILAGPIAKAPTAPGPDTEFIRVAKPTARLVVDWQSWRKGQRAQLPEPYQGDGNTILLESQISLDNLEIEGDAMNYFISSGQLIYGFLDRTKITLAHPLPPYLTLPDASVLVYKVPDFLDGILNAGWPNPSANTAITQATQ